MPVGRQTSGCGYIGAMYEHSNGWSVVNQVEADDRREEEEDSDGTSETTREAIWIFYCDFAE